MCRVCVCVSVCLCEAYIGEDALNIGEGFPDSSVGKEFTRNAGDPCSIPGSGRFPWRRNRLPTPVFLSFPCVSAGKESACNAGDLGLVPGLGRSPGEGKGYPLHYSGLENSMDCIVHSVAKSRTQLSNFHFHFALNISVFPIPYK